MFGVAIDDEEFAALRDADLANFTSHDARLEGLRELFHHESEPSNLGCDGRMNAEFTGTGRAYFSDAGGNDICGERREHWSGLIELAGERDELCDGGRAREGHGVDAAFHNRRDHLRGGPNVGRSSRSVHGDFDDFAKRRSDQRFELLLVLDRKSVV